MRGVVSNLGWMMLLAACSSPPVTDGFLIDLPKPGTPTIVWGNDPSVVGVATTWLQRRGLSLVERSTLVIDVEKERSELSHTLQDEAAILQAAKKLGVQEVVFVDRGGDYRAPLISVRGVHVESGRIHWSGSAWSSRLRLDLRKIRLPNLPVRRLPLRGISGPPARNGLFHRKLCAQRTSL